jgi:isoquinoline 1-oxidoreductase subunit beta
MVVAVVAHPPRFGGKVKSFDATEALKVKGVLDVKAIPQGVAVYATGTWQAFNGREALTIEWDDAASEMRGSDELLAEYRKLADTEGLIVRAEGDAAAALSKSAEIVEAEFVFPYLAHAAMEPMNAVVRFDGQTVQIWTASQSQTVDQNAAAAIFDVTPDNVQIETKYAGGSFGRRAVPTSDYLSEAAMVAKAWGKPDAVKLVWSREDDMKAGYYRPMYLHRVKAGLDEVGNLVAWRHLIVGQSIEAGIASGHKAAVDPTSVEGISDIPYAIPNFRAELHTAKVGVPVLWWRSVGHTHTAYAVETMIDRLAAKAGKDPVEFRIALLKDKPRHTGVLKLVADKGGWAAPLPSGTFRGLAIHESFSSYVAQVAEISIDAKGAARVKRVICVIDCGVAVNPDLIKAQMDGGIGFGLGAAMRNKITLSQGVVDQANFDSYEPLRISDMPEIEVYIIDSQQNPTGVGEPGVPPIAPAVANAVFKATGKTMTTLPLSLHDAGKA